MSWKLCCFYGDLQPTAIFYISSSHIAERTSEPVFGWLSSGITQKINSRFSCLVIRYGPSEKKFKETKRGACCCICWGAKRRKVGYILSLRITLRGKSSTKTSYSFCITISDFTCPSQSKETRKRGASGRDRDRVNEGVIAVKQSQCMCVCVCVCLCVNNTN